MWAAVKEFLSFKWVLNGFFCPYVLCGIWQFRAAPSLSILCSVRALCVYLTAWLRVAVPVWECQWLSVCHVVRGKRSVWNLRSRKSLVTLINWEQHDSSGKLQFEQPSYLLMTLGGKSVLCNLHSLALYWLLQGGLAGSEHTHPEWEYSHVVYISLNLAEDLGLLVFNFWKMWCCFLKQQTDCA